MTKKIDGVGENMIIPEADSGLIARSSIVFSAGDNLTTEKLTSAISLLNKNLSKDNEMRLCVDKAQENTVGDMTINIYEGCKVDGTTERYCLVATLVAELVTDGRTNRSFNISGLGYGTGNIKIGASFETDAGALTVSFALYRK